MFTESEKEILCSEEKRKSVAPQTVRNRMQKIRDKAAKAIEDLLLLGEKQPLQMAQVIGFTRTGRPMGRTRYEPGELFRVIDSKPVIKRLQRGERARMLAMKLALNTGIMGQWLNEKKEQEMKGTENVKLVDMQKLREEYPKILIGMLKNQFACPKCGKAGLIFSGEEDWLWMHYNRNDSHPKASFCNIGKTLPSEFVEFPFAIEPQANAFQIKLTDLSPQDRVRFYT